MENEEINRIIAGLQERNSCSEAVIGFHQYGGGPDESFIKGNRQGLELFAAELLKAALEAEKPATHDEPSIYIPDMEEWTDQKTGFLFHYIELQKGNRGELIPDTNAVQSWQSRLLGSIAGFGCILLIVVLGLSCFIGIRSILRWIL